MDKDGSGTIDEDEFVTAFATAAVCSQYEKAAALVELAEAGA